jgi:cyclopropane fatty-acyl-phospholipid synthase-like methyltransferase
VTNGIRSRGHRRRIWRSFIDRYVFPDGELHELGAVVSRMQASGFEVAAWRASASTTR